MGADLIANASSQAYVQPAIRPSCWVAGCPRLEPMMRHPHLHSSSIQGQLPCRALSSLKGSVVAQPRLWQHLKNKVASPPVLQDVSCRAAKASLPIM